MMATSHEIVEHNDVEFLHSAQTAVIGNECFCSMDEAGSDLQRIWSSQAIGSAKLSSDPGRTCIQVYYGEVRDVLKQRLIGVGNSWASQPKRLDSDFQQGEDGSHSSELSGRHCLQHVTGDHSPAGRLLDMIDKDWRVEADAIK